VSRVVNALAKTLGATALVGALGATVATVLAYDYRARTGEGFVFAYVFVAWALVTLVALTGGALLLSLRRSRR